MDRDPLTRRNALRLTGLVSIGWSGCLAGGSASDPPPSNGTSTPDSATPTTGSPAQTIASHQQTSARNPIDSTDFAFTAESIQQFTPSHPAQFELVFTNTGTTPLLISDARLGPRGSQYRVSHESTDAELMVVPSGISYASEATRSDGCWQAEGFGIPADLMVTQVDEGDRIREVFSVAAHHASEACLPPGEYQFSESHTLERESLENPGDESGRGGAVQVRFELSIRITEDTDLTIEMVESVIGST